MISAIELKAGPSPKSEPLSISTAASITVFVGPNNAGKSQLLRDINLFCTNGQTSALVILKNLTFNERTSEFARDQLSGLSVQPLPQERVLAGHTYIARDQQRLLVNDESFLNALSQPNRFKESYASMYARFSLLNLDGKSRMSLVGQQKRGDLKAPSTPLAKLLMNDEKRGRLRSKIFDAVGLYISIDAQSGDVLNIRFGDTEPPDERSFNDAAISYMVKARTVDAVSDGVKAYSGILLQLHSGDPEALIIDEPEAFLHPSLAFRLGKELAKGASEEGKTVFVSTHSAQFLMGAIQSGANLNIVRLTYENGVGAARLLENSDLKILMNDPLLRSVGVLNGLFYRNVVVGEGEADRAFYQEVNDRLLAVDDPRGISDVLFLNADNKQTIPKIIQPLRKLGIPSVAVIDLDVLKDSGVEFSRHLKAACIPDSEHQPIGTRRAKVLEELIDANVNYKTVGGIGLLKGSKLEAAENLLQDLSRYGLFVVAKGEIEAWLSTLAVPRSKHLWLRSIFEKMGNDPHDTSYVTPSSGDVWDFIGEIKNWLENPKRRGIPTN